MLIQTYTDTRFFDAERFDLFDVFRGDTIFSDMSIPVTEIINEVTVHGDFDARPDGNQTRFENLGTITGNVQFGTSGEDGAFEPENEFERDYFINSGFVGGSVGLGTANDLVRNTGTIEGNINMAFGDDKVVLLDGAVNGLLILGNGDDLIIFNGGTVNEVIGSVGSDTYVFYSGAEGVAMPVITEGPDFQNRYTDTIRSAIDMRIAEGIEELILIGTADIEGRGDQFDNIIHGNSGNNRLVGNAGDDTILGFGGNDILIGGAGDDFLSDGKGRNRYYGQEGDDLIRSDGNSKDFMFGGEGDDRLIAGKGNDLLVGGLGRDLLRGGEGFDVFKYETGNDSGLFGQGVSGFNPDKILDFERGIDKIDLSDVFGTGVGMFIGDAEFSGTGQVEVRSLTIGRTNKLISLDLDGDGVRDMEIFLEQVDELGIIEETDLILG